LNVLTLRPILPGMSRKPQPPQPTKTKWHVYKLAAKRQWECAALRPHHVVRQGACVPATYRPQSSPNRRRGRRGMRRGRAGAPVSGAPVGRWSKPLRSVPRQASRDALEHLRTAAIASTSIRVALVCQGVSDLEPPGVGWSSWGWTLGSYRRRLELFRNS
jgi:hypothetical protein